MKIAPSEHPDVLLLEPRVFPDERGFFLESWNRKVFADAGLDLDFVQDNHSYSVRGTLRGLHYQVPPRAQGKLVRVTRGEVWDVAVDLRRGSARFGQWVGLHLSADNRRMVWIPPGFAHGFWVASESADLLYKCTDRYAAEAERVVRWDDPDLAIDWPLGGRTPLLSERDRAGSALRDAETFP